MPMTTRIDNNAMKGFTLLEVMIALVIFSVGLIGLAGLQSTAVEDNSRSYYRVQANFLAYDILDRMRANRDLALSGNYIIGLGQPSATSCNGLTTCSPATMADADRYEWKQALVNNLPSGEGTVQRPGTNLTDPFVITVQWDDDRDSTTLPASITITAEL